VNSYIDIYTTERRGGELASLLFLCLVKIMLAVRRVAVGEKGGRARLRVGYRGG